MDKNPYPDHDRVSERAAFIGSFCLALTVAGILALAGLGIVLSGAVFIGILVFGLALGGQGPRHAPRDEEAKDDEI